jgi:hypothetical protein
MRRRVPLMAATMLMLALCASCAHQRAAEPKPGMVVHVVVCWLKTPGDEAQRQQLIDVSKTFKAIPGVVGVAAGRTLPSTRPVVDTTFDVGLVILFRDRQAMNDYLENPIHKKALADTLKPLVGKQIVYDIVE